MRKYKHGEIVKQILEFQKLFNRETYKLLMHLIKYSILSTRYKVYTKLNHE